MDAIRVAYADPPYVGQAKKHYDSEEVSHPLLLERLEDEYPDGWALSCSSPSIGYITSILANMSLFGLLNHYRVMAWVKPFAVFKPNVNPAYAWEPVIVRGGRKRTREQDTVRDWVSANITLKRGLAGVKPDTFSYWLFEVLGLSKDDELVDLYPGSGAVSRAWDDYTASEDSNG